MAAKRRTKTSSSDPEPTFEILLTQLEEVVERLEHGQLPLEESIAVFEKGMELRQAAETRLQEAERRVEILLKSGDNGDSAGQTRPYEHATDEVMP